MKGYDFNAVFSALEFQQFSRDMVQKREHIIFESFAEGRDSGMDGRYIAEDGETIIFQAKRYENMSSRILGIMKREKEKMDTLVQKGNRVDRYILALSEDIGPEKKNQIKHQMSPYIKKLSDIVMREDFNNLLGMPEYEAIEKKYYQLWIPGMNVLNRHLIQIVHARLLEKSRNCYRRMLDKQKLFVKTEVFRETILKAQKNRTVIISGEPGVGKTTLAEQVALYYLGKWRVETFLKFHL